MKKQAFELQHIDFYKTHGALVLNQILSPSYLKEAQKEALFFKENSLRNVWKSHKAFKALTLHKGLFHLSSELSSQPFLRIGYDHFFASFEELKNFFKAESSIHENSSIDGLEIALLLNLSSAEVAEDQTAIFPFASGSGCFIHPRRTLTFKDLEAAQGPFLLITYCKKNARYIHQPQDPFTHDGKKEGLVFGDLLGSSQHPLLCRC